MTSSRPGTIAGREISDPAIVGELGAAMGIRLVEASADRVVATMPVAGNRQPYGLLHGGANAVLAETLGSVHAALLAGPDKIVVGIDLNCTHHRAATDGTVTGLCTPLQAGRTVASLEIVISDDAGRRLCTSRLTCLTRDAPPGGPAPGASSPGAGTPAP